VFPDNSCQAREAEWDQSVAVSMCRNRVIVTDRQAALRAIQPEARTSFRQTEKQSTSQIENQLLSQKVITFSECTEKHFGNQLASGFNIQRAYTMFQYLQQTTRYCRQQLL
jgi:hypothetical protein